MLHNTDAIKGFELKYVLTGIYQRKPTSIKIYAVIRQDVVHPEKNYEVRTDRWKIGT
jgi:hypothetical protein